jgi:hypothetical protein
MTEQAKPSSLFRKIAAVAGAIESVEKDGKNKDQGYRYATPAGVMAAVKPHLAEHKLAIIPHLVDFQEIDTGQRAGSGKPFILNRVSMHYHIVDGESGDELTVPWQAQAGTYGDDKGLAKAQTIALRTFLIQLFQIPAEDPEIDPDARDARPGDDRQRQAPPRPAASPRPAPKPAGPAPSSASPVAVIRALWEEVRGFGQDIPPKILALDLDALDAEQIAKLEVQARGWLAKLTEAADQPGQPTAAAA